MSCTDIINAKTASVHYILSVYGLQISLKNTELTLFQVWLRHIESRYSIVYL
jgi:hypothetical protein